MRNDFNLQVAGVLYEYERALRDGAVTKAINIRLANPDLEVEFQAISTAVGPANPQAAS